MGQERATTDRSSVGLEEAPGREKTWSEWAREYLTFHVLLALVGIGLLAGPLLGIVLVALVVSLFGWIVGGGP